LLGAQRNVAVFPEGALAIRMVTELLSNEVTRCGVSNVR
jgi:hypothetical protein